MCQNIFLKLSQDWHIVNQALKYTPGTVETPSLFNDVYEYWTIVSSSLLLTGYESITSNFTHLCHQPNFIHDL